MALSPADFPAPVAPAIKRWGIAARSVTNGWPIASLPSASVSGPLPSVNSLERGSPGA